MQDLITALSALFTFLITQMGNVATFFTTNLIGQIILGVAVFSLVLNIIVMIINKLR